MYVSSSNFDVQASWLANVCVFVVCTTFDVHFWISKCAGLLARRLNNLSNSIVVFLLAMHTTLACLFPVFGRIVWSNVAMSMYIACVVLAEESVACLLLLLIASTLYFTAGVDIGAVKDNSNKAFTQSQSTECHENEAWTACSRGRCHFGACLSMFFVFFLVFCW
jgi:hypothetical protein